MDIVGRRNTSGMTIVFFVGIIYLMAIVTAESVSERHSNENTVGTYNNLLNFVKLGESNVTEQIYEEISRTANERHKRLSDQRRAELETLMALSKMTGRLVNVIRGGRQLEINRKRMKRSIFDLNVKNLQRLFRLSGKLGYKGNAAYPVIS